jgi:hypothetical protein
VRKVAIWVSAAAIGARRGSFMDLGMSIIHRSPRKRTNVTKALNTLGVERLFKPESAKSRATPHQASNITKNVSAARIPAMIRKSLWSRDIHLN